MMGLDVQRLEATLGQRIVERRTVAGGDINDAWRVRLGDDRVAFVKSHADPPPGMYAAEAAGLEWLRAADALAIPEVLAHADGPGGFLALSWVERGSASPRGNEALGRGLAELHRVGASTWGAVDDNFIGPLAQSNASARTWSEFYAERRLRPLVRRAFDAGLLSDGDRETLDAVLAGMATRVGPEEPPARLHGDLWAGNHLFDAQGIPYLIDPAVYAGHREVDLAMMRLFGGYDARVFEAYAEAWPLAAGWRSRVGLYQLYPLLVHLNLFGASYRGQLMRAATGEG